MQVPYTSPNRLWCSASTVLWPEGRLAGCSQLSICPKKVINSKQQQLGCRWRPICYSMYVVSVEVHNSEAILHSR